MQPRPISARHCCKSRVLGMFEQQIIGDSREPKLRGFALGSVSLSLHLGVLAAFWLIWFLSHGELRLQPKRPGIFIDLSQFVRPRIAYDTGGGGDLRKLPVSRGNLPPQRTTRVFIMPITNPRAQLTIPNSMPLMDAPRLDTDQIGDPNGVLGPPSLGPGGPFGMGNHGTGGAGNDFGPRAYHPGSNGVSTPILILKVEPEYSDEARRIKLSGKVLLKIIVDAKGVPSEIRVVQPLGFGLDEKAKEAVQNWRFRPGMKGGRAVPVEAVVEVSFRLL